MKVQTKIEFQGNKIVLIQNIYIKNSKIRIDTIGAFDEVLMSLLIEGEKIYVINYQKNLIYIFSNEEQFYKTFEIYLPIFNLPYLITLSTESLQTYKTLNDNFFVLANGDKIKVSRDRDSCTIRQIEILSKKSGNLLAIYRDYSLFDQMPLYHQVFIRNDQNNLNISISVIKTEKKDIPEQILKPDNFKNFGYVRQ